tara:strand:- start:5228 stop:6337 length:1110 start_codon:yes stop_codon:yes gene_type:complete
MISTTIFGLEYYNISNRDIVKTKEKSEIYTKHLQFFYSLSPILFIIQVLVFLGLFPKELITIRTIIFIVIIGICDYFAQEVYRYLMINKQYRKGNIQLIYKSVFFIIIIAIYLTFFKKLDFDRLLILLLISYLLLFIFAYNSFSIYLHHFSISEFKFLSFKKLKNILSVLSPFLLLILFIKGIEFTDKFLIGKILGLEEAGIYSFLFSMASVMGVFVMSGFYIIYLPQLLNNFKNNMLEFKSDFRKFSILTIGSSIVLAFLIVVGSPIVFDLVGKPILLDNLELLYLLLGGFVLYNAALIPHLFLYVCLDEKIISLIMGIALLINLSLNFFLIPKFGVNGAGYSFLITYAIIFSFKSTRAIVIWRKLVV